MEIISSTSYKPDPDEGPFCKIPHIENGYVAHQYYDQNYSSFEEVPVDMTVVKVVCEKGYNLEILEFVQTRICREWGWDGDFSKCTSK